MNKDVKICQRQENKVACDPSPGEPDSKNPQRPYDPELLYVECRNCGKPLVWEANRTTKLLEMASISIESLDENCLIISEVCPACCPGISEGFPMIVARVTEFNPKDLSEFLKQGGNA